MPERYALTFIEKGVINTLMFIQTFNSSHEVPSVSRISSTDETQSKESVSHTRLLSLYAFSLSFFSWRGLLSHSLPPVFHHSHRIVALLAPPCISPKSPLWRWKNIIWAQFPDRLPLSLSDGPPKANAGGSVYPSTHLSLNTKQTVTQPLHLSARFQGPVYVEKIMKNIQSWKTTLALLLAMCFSGLSYFGLYLIWQSLL